MSAQNRQVLLLLDNCSAHIIDGLILKNVTLLFFPPNTTSVLQPMDQGIIQNMKVHYKRQLVSSYIVQLELPEPTDPEKTKKIQKWNVLQACNAVADAWEKVSKTTIYNCFNRMCVFPESSEVEANLATDDFDAEEEYKPEFEELLHIDNQLPSSGLLEISDLLPKQPSSLPSSSSAPDDDESSRNCASDSENSSTEADISRAEMIQAFRTIQNGSSRFPISSKNRIAFEDFFQEYLVASKPTLVQKKIRDFFK